MKIFQNINVIRITYAKILKCVYFDLIIPAINYLQAKKIFVT
jgi:hypothetical protein